MASCGWLAARREMRSTANVSQTLRGTEWKSLLKRLPKARRIYHAGKKLNEFAALTLVRCPVVNPNADYMQGLTPLALATWKESRLEYDRRGIVGSSLSNTCCFSRVSTTMRADPHLRYRRDSNKKKKPMSLSPLVCARFKS